MEAEKNSADLQKDKVADGSEEPGKDAHLEEQKVADEDEEPEKNSDVKNSDLQEEKVAVGNEELGKCILCTEDPDVPSNPVFEFHMMLDRMTEQEPNVDGITCACKGASTCISAVCRCFLVPKGCDADCTCEDCNNERGTAKLAGLKRMNRALNVAAAPSKKPKTK